VNTTTTHDPHGGGDPSLIFTLGGFTQTDEDQRVFHLLPGVTRIGSAADADLQLSGIEPHHAEIRRDADDEYHFVQLIEGAPSSVDGRPMGTAVLRTGCRVEVGDWTMSYYREEFADHGRPYGGRVGGNNGYQRPQDTPRARGTSDEGGSEQSRRDEGEYF
jgi:hypothetical protein